MAGLDGVNSHVWKKLRCLDDLEAMLRERGDWVLGNADEQKPAAEGTVEAWARAEDNPVGGWYGLKKGLRGRFGNDVPPGMEARGRAEVEPNARMSWRRDSTAQAEGWQPAATAACRASALPSAPAPP